MEVKGTLEIELMLSRLADPKIAKEVVWAGAQPVADEIRKNIENLPEDTFRYLRDGEQFNVVSKEQKQDLLDSLGITPPDIDRHGNANVKIGIHGYGRFRTKKYPKGLPNALLARAIESGSSVRKKRPFIRPAVNRSKDKAIKAMEEKLHKEIESIIKQGR